MTRACLVAVACVLATSCTSPNAPPPATTAPPAQAAATSTGIPHGDHNPRFGGVVYMNGDLHFEVVLGRDGRHRVYFSDAVRNELPAATASDVRITVTQKGRPPEEIRLAIDDSGESWVGQGHAITDPDASARVAYTTKGEPYFIDVPMPK